MAGTTVVHTRQDVMRLPLPLLRHRSTRQLSAPAAASLVTPRSFLLSSVLSPHAGGSVDPTTVQSNPAPSRWGSRRRPRSPRASRQPRGGPTARPSGGARSPSVKMKWEVGRGDLIGGGGGEWDDEANGARGKKQRQLCRRAERRAGGEGSGPEEQGEARRTTAHVVSGVAVGSQVAEDANAVQMPVSGRVMERSPALLFVAIREGVRRRS